MDRVLISSPSEALCRMAWGVVGVAINPNPLSSSTAVVPVAKKTSKKLKRIQVGSKIASDSREVQVNIAPVVSSKIQARAIRKVPVTRREVSGRQTGESSTHQPGIHEQHAIEPLIEHRPTRELSICKPSTNCESSTIQETPTIRQLSIIREPSTNCETSTIQDLSTIRSEVQTRPAGEPITPIYKGHHQPAGDSPMLVETPNRPARKMITYKISTKSAEESAQKPATPNR